LWGQSALAQHDAPAWSYDSCEFAYPSNLIVQTMNNAATPDEIKRVILEWQMQHIALLKVYLSGHVCLFSLTPVPLDQLRVGIQPDHFTT
jgi:hypothetical protein